MFGNVTSNVGDASDMLWALPGLRNSGHTLMNDNVKTALTFSLSLRQLWRGRCQCDRAEMSLSREEC